MTESLSLRVVRIVHSVAPRRLTASAVIDSCPGDKGANVYASLSNLSQDKGPLDKKRSDGGVLDYGVRPGFDIAAYLEEKKDKPARRTKLERMSGADADSLGICVRIVQSLRRLPKRLTADDLEGTGHFPDRKALVLHLALLCEPGEPLERERQANDKPFHYGIKRDFDVDAWIKERGEEPLTLPASPGTPSAAPKVPEAARPGTGVAEADPRKVEPAPSVKDTQLATPSSVAALTPPVTTGAAANPAWDHISQPGKLAAAPAKPRLYDLSTELAIIAAANLAAAVRDCSFEGVPELERALLNFERADRAREESKGATT